MDQPEHRRSYNPASKPHSPPSVRVSLAKIDLEVETEIPRSSSPDVGLDVGFVGVAHRLCGGGRLRL